MAGKKQKRSTSPEQVNAFYQALVKTVPPAARKKPFEATDLMEYMMLIEELGK